MLDCGVWSWAIRADWRPQAEGFYQRLLMPDYGPDPEKDDLIYFEYGILEQ